MLASELRYSIEIWHYTTTEKKTSGAEVKQWVLLRPIKSAIKYLSGNEKTTAEISHDTQRIRFKVRYTKDIKTTHRVKYEEQLYNITNIDPHKQLGSMMIFAELLPLEGQE